MEALTRGLVLELAPRRFNTLSSGATDSPLLDRTIDDARDGYAADLSAKLPLKPTVSWRKPRWAPPSVGHSINSHYGRTKHWSIKMSTPINATAIEIAETFFEHWNHNRLDEALAMLAPNVLYDNVPFPDIVGRDEVAKFHRGFGIGTDFLLDWKIVNMAAAGNVVLNERLDLFKHVGGGVISLPVMGTLTIEDGQITVWRDYFDPADFDRQLAVVKAG